MSRRHPTAELYDERQSDHYRSSGPPPRRSTREFAELDAELQRGQQQDLHFLDDDYGRRSGTAGPLVIRERAPPAPPAPPRSVVHEDDVLVEIDERKRRPARRRTVEERDEVDVVLARRDEGSVRPAGPRRPVREPRTRDVERDEIVVDHREVRRNGRVVDHRDDILIRSDDRGGRQDRLRHDREIVLEHISNDRSQHPRPSSPPRTRARSREKGEEIIIERRRARSRSSSFSRSPPRRRAAAETEEIVIRTSQRREPSPVRVPPPEPEPLPPIIRAPIHQKIHQEVITHHRHIDHGVERAYSPSPPPRLASPVRNTEDTIEVDIRRRGRGGLDQEIVVEHDHRRRRDHDSALAIRHRSHSPSSRRQRGRYDDDLQEEADYYNQKAMQRAYVGEAYNGATRDWNIVDVPPGTERVSMDGAGGSSQEITWQRYNGVRRSKFLAGGREYDTGVGTGDHDDIELPPMQPVPSKMWTEITKDLVIRDAIDAFGYQYEETEFFFYVMEYLRYEEVLQLVELSDDMRQDRKRRIHEIEWEREQIIRLEREDRLRRERERELDRERERDRPERYYEHEVIVDTRRRR